MQEQNKDTLKEEKAEIKEMAELIKKLSPKEKERVLYMLHGAVMISEAANTPQAAAV